jgi:hypothetical protein
MRNHVVFDQTDILYAFAMLKQDARYKDIPHSKVLLLIEAALEQGRTAAEKVVGQIGYLDAIQLCQHYQIQLNEMPLYMIGKSVRGLYVNEPPAITINPSAVDELALNKGLESSLIRKAIVFHEVYHFLERHGFGLTWQVIEPIWYKGLLGKKRRLHIETVCDIAAHSFAQKYGRLEFYPGELDCIEDLDILKVELESLKIADKKEG